MRANTRLFGDIDIPEEKIITLDNGIIGFPDMKHFTLIFDEEKKGASLMWFQSMDEPQFAMPVMQPQIVMPEYNPTINDSLLQPLGDLNENNLYVLVTVTVPPQIEKISVNLKAPIIVNMDTLKGAQLIVEDDLSVRYAIYDILKKAKEGAGE